MKTLARPTDRAEVIRRLRTVRPESVARWGRMSAHQMVCHLADCFRMAVNQKLVTPDTSPIRRTIVKWVALYAPVRWPSGILTSAEIDQELGGTRPTEFAADVAQVEALVERVTSPAEPLDRQPHPMFGRLSDAGWLRWGYLHMDHHLRQFGA